MRLDKYLKVSRLIKRRTVAKEIADKGRIQVNGQIAKSSTNVKEGDLIKILFGNKILEVRVVAIKETTKKDEAKDLYEIISETQGNTLETL
ncbi:RNA-binding S4 domain-containing protein [Vagococcus silagei]|uniref:RQC P-site tRNA stabilizing factor n=1 Tax=Vagococcus silagei TaxID=2508885 RepID=A0A4S3AZR5_9ENTE|nr:RNA-binding S4 domain-containing protein [Vagococcus silagei]THB60241.1 RNA-binding S4 domain-containing protein [Vagococcus silagei]